MPKFNVQIGRNVRVYHTATIEADSLEDLKNRSYKDSMLELSKKWENDGADEPEKIETVNIVSLEDEKVIASWSEGDGWHADD